MGKKIFGIYLAKLDLPNSEAHARLELPASPWELWDALDMKFINYTNDGRVVVQHAALILSKLDETDTLELHTMDNAIILLKKDMTLVETRDVLQGMVRFARSMTLDALCNSDAEDKTPLVDESVDDEYEDTITIPVPLEAFGDAGLLGKDLHIQVIDGAVVITEDTDDE